jgi:ATP-binding cassette subfamily B (MDR/TAP) protein 1
LVDLPKGKQTITRKWVYNVKVRSTRKPTKLKTRLTAYGFQHIEGLDYDEKFVLVIKWGTIRTIVTLATHKGWEVNQLDVKTTFLNGELKEEMYMVQPKGFVYLREEGKVCKVQKTLYRLKQALRV